MEMHSPDHAWLQTLDSLLREGRLVAPRGQPTLELPQATIVIDMRQPVLRAPARRLSYQFMAAEAHWILSGDDTVAGIAPWNREIAKFSDDGKTFFGAYGPRISAQLDYVVDKLQEDPSSRQAGLAIWRERPPPTRDVPCTVAIFAAIRENLLNQPSLRLHVFMRSSDAWLGLPYDVFNFSMLGHLLCCRLQAAYPALTPGRLHLTAASSHLYEERWDAARACVAEVVELKAASATPPELYTDEKTLLARLRWLRDSKRGDALRWWEAA